MCEVEFGCVQEVAVQRERLGVGGPRYASDVMRRAIERVADDGMAERLHVYTNLVRASGLDVDLQQREPAMSTVDALDDAPVRDGVAAAGASSGHACAAHDVAADGKMDRAFVTLDVAMHERDVDLAQVARGEVLRERAMRDVVLGDDNEPAGLLVETVHDAGTQLTTSRRELLTEVKEQRVHQRATVVLERSCAGVDAHACSLVDDGEIVILVDDVERKILGLSAKRSRVWLAFDVDLLTAAELVAGLSLRSVDGDLTVFDEQLHTPAADMWQGFGEVGVETHLRGRGFGDEAADAGLGLEVFEYVNLLGRWLQRLQSFVAALGRSLDLVTRAGSVGDA